MNRIRPLFFSAMTVVVGFVSLSTTVVRPARAEAVSCGAGTLATIFEAGRTSSHEELQATWTYLYGGDCTKLDRFLSDKFQLVSGTSSSLAESVCFTQGQNHAITEFGRRLVQSCVQACADDGVNAGRGWAWCYCTGEAYTPPNTCWFVNETSCGLAFEQRVRELCPEKLQEPRFAEVRSAKCYHGKASPLLK